MREQQSKLIKIAAELVQGANLPSDMVDDYPQKTYSASRVAQMMMKPRGKLALMGIELREVANALCSKPLGNQVQPVLVGKLKSGDIIIQANGSHVRIAAEHVRDLPAAIMVAASSR